MSYFNKYQKYKYKYLQLKGGTLKEHIVYKISYLDYDEYNIVLKSETINSNENVIKHKVNGNLVYEYNNKETKLYHGNYTIKFNKKIKDKKKINLTMDYECKICKLSIILKNVQIEFVKNNIINFKLNEIKNIMIVYNDGSKDNITNIKSSKLLPIIFKLGEVTKNKLKIIDICKSNKINENDNLEIISNIYACNTIYTKFSLFRSSKYFHLLNFIYTIYFEKHMNELMNHDINNYIDSVTKKYIPINILPEDIKIDIDDKHQKLLTECFNDGSEWRIVIDTGNVGYSSISKRFLKMLDIEKVKYEKKNICLEYETYGSKYSCNKVILFYLYMKNIKYLIVADISDQKDDILFGQRNGINLFFNNNYIIGSKYDGTMNTSKYNINMTYRKFINKIDDLVCDTKNNFSNLFNDVINEIYLYNGIVLTKEQLTNARDDFHKNIIKKIDNIDINNSIYTYFRNNNIIIFDKDFDLTYGLDNYEYEKVIRKHINSLEKVQEIEKLLDTSKDKDNILLSKLLSLIMRY